MTKYLFPTTIVFFFILSPVALKAQLTGTSYSAAKSTKQATLHFVYDNTKGFAYRETSGEMKGVLVELIAEFEKYVESKTGIQVTIQYDKPTNDFQNFMQKVRDGSGGVFGLSNVSIKEERKEFYQFSPAYLTNVSVLISNSSMPTLTDLSQIGEAFGSMMAYSVPETTYMQRLSEIRELYFPQMQITDMSSVDEVMQRIAEDNQGFGIVDLHYYFQFLERKKPIKRHKVGDKVDEEFGIIMPLSNDWAPLLREFMDGGFLKSQGYKRIVQENLGLGGLRLIIE